MQALMVGVGLWLGVTFLAQLIPVLEKLRSRRLSRWGGEDPHRAVPTVSGKPEPGWIWDPSCRYFSRSPHLPCAVNPLGPCRCPHYSALPQDSTRQRPAGR